MQQFKVEARDVIDERKVVAALERYIQDHRPEPTVAIALKTHRPEIDGENIVLAVDNQLQQDKLEALKMHLRNVLMKLLNNGFITLSFKLFDDQNSTEEKKLFTAGEKFRHFIEPQSRRCRPEIDIRVGARLKKVKGLTFYFLSTSLELAWAVGMMTMSFRQTWAGRVIAKMMVSAISSLVNGVMP